MSFNVDYYTILCVENAPQKGRQIPKITQR